MFAKCGEMSKAQEEGGMIPGSWAPPVAVSTDVYRGKREGGLFLPLHF